MYFQPRWSHFRNVSEAFRVLCLLTCQPEPPPFTDWTTSTCTHTFLKPEEFSAEACDIVSASALARALSSVGACLSQACSERFTWMAFVLRWPPLRAGRSLEPFHPGSGPAQVSHPLHPPPPLPLPTFRKTERKNCGRERKGREERCRFEKGGQRLRWA